MRNLSKASLCSTLALATALLAAPRPAAAQFVGTVISQTGANAHTLGNGQLQVNVTSPQAVINWSATGASNNGLVTFQNANAVAEFQGNGNFAVLNRVFPTTAGSAIMLNGTITTSINGQNGGGTVFFYSPNGIVIGANAAINVGSLGLTTLNLLDDGNGNWLSGFGNATRTLNFQQANSNSYIRVDPNASLGVFGQNNYIALVAPRIDVQGTIKTDGVAALVAAEAATMTIRDGGLWDIQVTNGTEGDNDGISLTGEIKRNTAAVGYNHRAYLVSVAKNDAMTMLFGAGSKLGFEVAGSAGVEGNAVVLSAGKNIVNGEIGASAGAGESNIGINGATISSALYAGAKNSIDINSDSGATSFGGNVALTADNISIRATNNNVTVAGTLTATADRNASSGDATGGDIFLTAMNGKTLNLVGATNLFARGYGGFAATGTAGEGTGGHILMTTASGGHLTFGGLLNATAHGYGGNSGGGTGGLGRGGTIEMYANGGSSTIAVGGKTQLLAYGYGGERACDSCLVTGGVGRGGTINVNGGVGSGNTLTFAAFDHQAQGFGGIGNIAGGAGYGGTTALASGDGTVITVNGTYLNFADGIGGNGDGAGHGGAAFGGSAGIYSFGTGGGAINFNGSGVAVHVTAEGFGGLGGLGGGNGGNATGGSALVAAPGVTVNSPSRQLYISAYALGGNAAAGTGGNALGGDATLDVAGNVAAGGGVWIRAHGAGGNGVAGGDGHGGNASINVGSGILTASAVSPIDAYGVGGTASGAGQEGGDGDGGHAALRNTGTGTLTLGAMTLSAYGLGGAAALGDAGDANGGEAEVFVSGGTTNFTSTLLLDAKGTGGAGAGGGAAGGGWARIYGSGGTANFTGAVTVTALATGGAGTSMAGGNATGGRARLNADGASYHLYSNLTLNSNSVGGAGTTGGNANGVYGANEINSAIFANNGGSIIVDGSSNLTADATGGNALAGSGGAGGSAIGGKAGISANGGTTGNGTITVNIANIQAAADGGNGGSGGAAMAGGAGGAAQAGDVQLYIGASTSGTNSITGTTVNMLAIGTGGDGGAGGNGAVGGAGGVGGKGSGGEIIALANSANGHLDLGRLWAIGVGGGGIGGNGGTGSAGVGGAGGNGGDGEGGVTTIGTSNPGNAFTANNGLTEIDNLLMFNDSYGGAGGNGGGGSGGTGHGGNGGDALASRHILSAWGGTATLGTVDVLNDQAGGNGGTGSTAGAGGDAYTSDIFIYSTDRTGVANTRADLNITTLNARSTAHNATGSTQGQSIALGGHMLFVRNSDADFGTYGVAINANNGIDAASYADPIRILGGTVTATGAFTVNTDNNMSVVLDGGSLTAGSVTLSAADFEYDVNYSPAANRGTISAGSIGITSGKDIILDAKLASLGGLYLDASNGLVDLGNLNAGGNIDVIAGTTIKLGNIVSGGYTSLTGDGNITTGTINASNIWAQSYEGSLGLGDLTSLGDVELNAETTIAFGNVTAGDTVDFDSDEGVVGGNIIAGRQISGTSGGSTVLGNLSAGLVNPAGPTDDGFSVGIASETSILVGNIAGAESVGFATLGTLTGGTLQSGGDVLIMASGDINFDSIAAAADGRIYIGDGQMFIDAGGGEEDSFDPELVYAQVPVPTHGSITIDGTISGGSLQAAAGNDFTAGTIDVAGLLFVEAGSSISTGNVSSGLSIELTAGDLNVDTLGSILVGDVQSDGSINFAALGSVNGDEFTAGGHVAINAGTGVHINDVNSGSYTSLQSGKAIIVGAVDAGGDVRLVASGGAITAGNLKAGMGVEDEPSDIAINGSGTVTTGTLLASNHVLMAAKGNLSTGTIGAGEAVIALSDGTINLGNVTAGGLFYIGGTGIMATAGDIGDDFSLDALDLGATNASGGTATVGTINVGELSSYSQGNFVSQSITSDGPAFAGSDGSVTTGAVNAGGYVTLSAFGGALNSGAITSGGTISLTGDTSVTTGALSAGGSLFADAGTTLTINGSVSAEEDVVADAGTALTITGNTTAGGAITLDAGTTLTTGNLTAGAEIALNAAGAILTGAISSGFGPGQQTFGLTVQGVEDGVTITSDESVTTGSIESAYGILIDAGTTIATGALTAGSGIDLIAGSGINVAGKSDAGGFVRAKSTSGPITLGAVEAGTMATIESAGAVTGSTILAGNAIAVTGGSGVTLTNLTTTGNGNINVGSGQNVSVGNLDAAGDVNLQVGGTLASGSILADGSVYADVGQSAAFGAVTTSGQGVFSVTGYPGQSTTVAGIADATGGSVQLNGPVSTGQMVARVGGDFTANAINASSIDAKVGGLATINGQWAAGLAKLSSNDIAIGTNGAIQGNSIQLFSTNATQTGIGGGLTTTGYLLDGGEFSKLSAPQLLIYGRSDASGAIDMLVGDLALANTQGTTLVQLAVANPQLTQFGGVMRVVGNVTASNYGDQDYLALAAGRIEIDAAKATIALNGTTNGLGGTLTFLTPHLHAAEATILDKLAVDQNFANRDLALQTPTVVARPDGYVRADNIIVDLTSGQGDTGTNPYTVLVQNSGTVNDRAGFVAGYAEIDTADRLIDLVVNGQLATAEGLLTGKDVRDALMEEDDPARFTATSTINGCGVGGGSCKAIPAPPKPVVYDPGPPVADQIVLFTAVPTNEIKFGNEEAIEDNQEDGGENSASSPITPPNPLFDTRDLTFDDETTEPVSGGGNPALMGGSADDDDDEDEDEETKKEKAKKGQKS